jgi:hypothetical protein
MGVFDLGDTGSDTQIDGIFLDQMGNFPDLTANTTDNITVGEYYRELFEYIKNVAPGDYDAVIGNPGAASPTDWQLDDLGQNPTQVADEVVIFEGTPATLDNFEKPEWVDNYPASDIGMLVYDVSINDIDDVCEVLKDNNAGLVDVTDGVLNQFTTPWNTVQGSTYWSSFTSNC